MAIEFSPMEATPWAGKYKTPQKRESKFHVNATNQITVEWKDDDLDYHCPVMMGTQETEMADVINKTKQRSTGQRGGSFVINEFGQILCPVGYPSFDRYHIGNCTGAFKIKSPLKLGKFFTLDAAADLKAGDDWNAPYLGIKYNLRDRDDAIYFAREDEAGKTHLLPPKNDLQLVHKLRSLRRRGPVSFVVNMHGIALTRVSIGDDKWKTKFVGRIDYNCWFDEE